MYNLPNILTLLRVILIPVFVALFYYPSELANLWAAIAFVLAALTDLLDGYLARKLKQTTKFGAFLDPVADKIMVCTALVLIVEYYSVHVHEFFPHINLLVSLPAMVIIAREIVVSALREWMAEIGQRAQVAVNWVGKWKTTIQMVAIAGLVWRDNEPMIYASLGMLLVATILTIWSMIMYLRVGLSHMTEESFAAAESGAANPPHVVGQTTSNSQVPPVTPQPAFASQAPNAETSAASSAQEASSAKAYDATAQSAAQAETK